MKKMLSPSEISEYDFTKVEGIGYDMNQVDGFFDKVNENYLELWNNNLDNDEQIEKIKKKIIELERTNQEQLAIISSFEQEKNKRTISELSSSSVLKRMSDIEISLSKILQKLDIDK